MLLRSLPLPSLVRRALTSWARRRAVAEASAAAKRWTDVFTAEVIRLHLEHGGFDDRSGYCPICTSRVRYAGGGRLEPRTSSEPRA